MTVRKTSVAVDMDLLEAARELLGTTTIRDTIDRALRDLIISRARREEIVALAAMDGMDLADPEIMAGAWRRG